VPGLDYLQNCEKMVGLHSYFTQRRKVAKMESFIVLLRLFYFAALRVTKTVYLKRKPENETYNDFCGVHFYN
jgi:hypothetical protein